MAFLSRRILLRSGLAAGGLVAAGLGGPGTAYAETVDSQGFDPLGGETDGRRRRWRPVAEDVRAELRRAWRAYKRFAWGHDELHPLTNSFGEFFDDAHPVGLTIVEALDTLYLMGLDDELEDGTLWGLVGDDRYYKAAKKAFKAVVDRRSAKDLVGTAMNIETGAWLDMTASIHPPVDSFFEYLFDGWDLFRDVDLLRWYHL